ncbi:cell cycle family protein [Lactobacillus selangorensis]|uniref:Cell cycle family protein n=1 Tax=Lactobacillus selangorensis TaxID=81857 RepID=A0A0R2FL79_9LACO|nr:FtsW/RodA/SpoVE family cell cycle protein [Lactobacillus selangorensis]KRN29320.1 cell cycle family protein [Lactobacillus selangorensis]KRN34151.1 cell cycle family protein [Lactobacillus selangorensis]
MQREASERANRDLNSRIDYGIILSVMLLALIGLAAIYISTSHDTTGASPLRATIMQGLWYVIGGIAIVVIMQMDSEQLWKIAPYAYGVGLFLLAAVFIFYSRAYYAKTGSKNWFAIGSITFQPSEIMKPAYILMLGRVITQHNDEYPHTTKNDWLLIGRMLLWTLPIFMLLTLEDDFGTSLVFLAIFSGMVLVSGVTWKILVPIASIGAVVGGSALALVLSDGGQAFLRHFGFKAYQFARVNTWRNPSQDTSGNGYQLWQSMKAIGSGQLFGIGFNKSKVYVPVRESDMIFSVIGEDFGFIGSCFVILVYFMLIYQMIRVTFDTKNEFYAYVSTGVIMMILFHVFENIGMNIGLLPLTGIPLPFISQGGSSLLGNMIGVGMVMSMRYHYRSYMFSDQGDF